jgi:hypothetical protein
MGHSAGAGDKLARGAVRASYLTTEKKITEKKWDSMFADFDPEAFKKTDPQKAAATGVKEGSRSRR